MPFTTPNWNNINSQYYSHEALTATYTENVDIVRSRFGALASTDGSKYVKNMEPVPSLAPPPPTPRIRPHQTTSTSRIRPHQTTSTSCIRPHRVLRMKHDTAANGTSVLKNSPRSTRIPRAE